MVTKRSHILTCLSMCDLLLPQGIKGLTDQVLLSNCHNFLSYLTINRFIVTACFPVCEVINFEM